MAGLATRSPARPPSHSKPVVQTFTQTFNQNQGSGERGNTVINSPVAGKFLTVSTTRTPLNNPRVPGYFYTTTSNRGFLTKLQQAQNQDGIFTTSHIKREPKQLAPAVTAPFANNRLFAFKSQPNILPGAAITAPPNKPFLAVRNLSPARPQKTPQAVGLLYRLLK